MASTDILKTESEDGLCSPDTTRDMLNDGKNMMFFGDNLQILRKCIPKRFVDLIYIDPPFNSNKSYNILFEQGDVDTKVQEQAYEDTWKWDSEIEERYADLTIRGYGDLKIQLDLLRDFILKNDAIPDSDMAYLVMMTTRLIELNRILKNTGSIFLHCDPTMSHYLKIIMDAIFGKMNFRNEIIWRRGHTMGSQKSIGRIHDTILYYTKSKKFTFNQQYTEQTKEQKDKQYRYKDDVGSYSSIPVVANKALQGGGSMYAYQGYTPEYGWLISKEKLEALDKEGKLIWTKNGNPRRKQYLKDRQGVSLRDIWLDINNIQSSKEGKSVDYPTQKPVKLLERIINLSSNEGDIILDAFCGSGTTMVACSKLNRKWIGIDLSMLATGTTIKRINDLETDDKYYLTGFPQSIEQVEQMIEENRENRFKLEYWVNNLLRAKVNKNQRGDGGVDGTLYFRATPNGLPSRKVLIQVKTGKVGVKDIRELIGVVDVDKSAEIGYLVCLKEKQITEGMKKLARQAGHYTPPKETLDRFVKHPAQDNVPKIPKIGIISIEKMIKSEKPYLLVIYPHSVEGNQTFYW